MRIADCVTGLVFLGLSVAYYFIALELPFSPSFGDPGPAELPKLVAALGAAVSIILISQGVRSGTGEGKQFFPRKGGVFLLWSLLATTAIPHLNTPLALAIYIFGGILIQSGRSGLRLAIVCAPLITGVVYSLFQLLLGVPLP